MNIIEAVIEAVKTKKKFKRKDWEQWCNIDLNINQHEHKIEDFFWVNDNSIRFEARFLPKDIVADDWVIEGE